jgi:hypothetical protein
LVVPLAYQGLGEKAVFGSGQSGAGCLWRRGNTVLSAWMYPIGDSSLDVAPALETYAREVDERAESRQS